MAITKLSGILFVGIIPPFFVKDKLQYAMGILPSFWISKFAMEEKCIYLLMGIVVSGIWLVILFKRFKKKIVM